MDVSLYRYTCLGAIFTSSSQLLPPSMVDKFHNVPSKAKNVTLPLKINV